MKHKLHTASRSPPLPRRENVWVRAKKARLTFEVLGAADEFDSREQRYATRQQHGEAAQGEVAVQTRLRSGDIPTVKLPALGLVVNVVEQAVFWYQQRVALEGTL